RASAVSVHGRSEGRAVERPGEAPVRRRLVRARSQGPPDRVLAGPGVRLLSARGLAVSLAAALALSGAAAATAAAAVSVYPFPNSRYEMPQTQIAFRGIPAGQIGSVTVVGSRSGTHTGRLAADSDGQGGSFLPDKPFTLRERVTVTTHLSLTGAPTGK